MARCKDCPKEDITAPRPAPHPGPRCASHFREFKAAQKAAQHGKRIEATYGITARQYQRLYEYQGGRCWICRRATGATKKLAVDHSHKTNAVRGLLCGPCNRGVLGHLFDDPAALRRAADYLDNPPAQELYPGLGLDHNPKGTTS